MSETLTRLIDPIRLAERGSRISGTVPVARLERLVSLLADDKGEVSAELTFGRDAGGQRFVAGHAQATVWLECQRCLEIFAFDVDVEFSLALVGSDSEAERLSEAYEPKLVGDDLIRAADIIEDELILGLPIVPAHESACRSAHREHEGSAGEGESEETHKPFAGLADLMKS